MPQEDRIYSTGREAIESLREDYRDFNDDPDESFEEFAGDVLDIFNAAPDAVFSYDPQIRPGSIQRLPEPSREELLGLCSLAARSSWAGRGTARTHMIWCGTRWLPNGSKTTMRNLFHSSHRRSGTASPSNSPRTTAAAASGVLEDSALENVAHAHGPVDGPSTKGRRVFCTIQWARDDIAQAIEDAIDPSYDVRLDRHGSQGEQVEALIDQVIG